MTGAPAGKIREILLKNKQVFMWVAGHLHIAAPSKSFNSEINLYEKQVWVIHNADMNGSSIFSEETMSEMLTPIQPIRNEALKNKPFPDQARVYLAVPGIDCT